jgi:lipid II:glycine glycyltransferase (peptidoglycan interpeptide bridge formation enzyme)
MRVVEIAEPQEWDQSLLDLPNPHILQSWAWGAVKSRHGWSATRLLFQEEGRTVAAASVLERQLPRLPVSILYVPKGPILDWKDAGLAERIMVELEHLVRRRRALFLKIDPDVYYQDDVLLAVAGGRATNAGEMARTLHARGWRLSDDQIQFRNTVLLDLVPPEDELLAAMKSKTRYNVRLAMRRGVTVVEGTTDEDLEVFYRLYAETAQRDGFLIRPPEYYRDAWGSFLEAGLARLLLAEFKGEAVAGLVLFAFGATAWYMYGASSNRHRKHMPNQLLQWEAIRQARSAGCRLYDLWGAPDELDESDPMWGVVRFKLGLGGQLVQGLGAWDFPVTRAGYRFYTAIMPRYLGWLRGRNLDA